MSPLEAINADTHVLLDPAVPQEIKDLGPSREKYIDAPKTERLRSDPKKDRYFARVPLETILDDRLSGSHLKVFAVIAVHARYVPISLTEKEISSVTGYSQRQVRRTILELEQYGHITVLRRFRYPNVYTPRAIAEYCKPCRNCKAPNRFLSKARGWCRTCIKSRVSELTEKLISRPRKAAQVAS